MTKLTDWMKKFDFQPVCVFFSVKRFESNLKIVNKEFTSALTDLSSSEYRKLTDELTTAVNNCNSKSRRSKPSHSIIHKLSGENEILKKLL